MTEKKGGSDVASGTDTIAIKKGSQNDGKYLLYGYKFWTSAIDADITLTLARIVDKNGQCESGSKGLSMFLVKLRNEKNELNNIQVIALKDKLGTRQLPTAELLLNGTEAILISEPGKGVKLISNMLNTTRIHNSISAVSAMRRMIALVRDYSDRREVFGKKLNEQELHVQIVSELELSFRGNLVLLLSVGRILEKIEHKQASTQEKTYFRFMTPLIKLFTAKECVKIMSEGIECFGGLGYLENTQIPVMLRDNQVLTIWEGTTNVLSMDLIRVLSQSTSTILQHIQDLVKQKVEEILRNQQISDQIGTLVQTLLQYFDKWSSFVEKAAKQSLVYNARKLAFNYCFLHISLELAYVFAQTNDQTDFKIFQFWIERMQKQWSQLEEDKSKNQKEYQWLKQLALDMEDGKKRGVGNVDANGNPRARL